MNILFYNAKSEHTSEVSGPVTIDNAEWDSPEQMTVYLSDGHYITLTKEDVDVVNKAWKVY